MSPTDDDALNEYLQQIGLGTVTITNQPIQSLGSGQLTTDLVYLLQLCGLSSREIRIVMILMDTSANRNLPTLTTLYPDGEADVTP